MKKVAALGYFKYYVRLKVMIVIMEFQLGLPTPGPRAEIGTFGLQNMTSPSLKYDAECILELFLCK
jgi:hypothetical protein